MAMKSPPKTDETKYTSDKNESDRYLGGGRRRGDAQ